ncbi:MAG: hypothetical protein HC933_12095, partial [Pleurocapsa sp. SU_196_0]|nr:hypothetical protein [Pleurocapsa sp. SU_196_0]
PKRLPRRFEIRLGIGFTAVVEREARAGHADQPIEPTSREIGIVV